MKLVGLLALALMASASYRAQALAQSGSNESLFTRVTSPYQGEFEQLDLDDRTGLLIAWTNKNITACYARNKKLEAKKALEETLTSGQMSLVSIQEERDTLNVTLEAMFSDTEFAYTKRLRPCVR